MAKKNFNPSLTLPIVDIIVAVILVVATGYFWFHSSGETRLANAFQNLRETRADNAAELAEVQQNLAKAEQDLKNMREQRDAKARYVEFLETQIDVETQAIADAQERDEQYTNEVLDLRTEIQRNRDRRQAYNSDIFEREEKIETATGRIDDLVAQVDDRNDQLDRLDEWITEAEVQLAQDPPSRFPTQSAFSSLYEIKDPHQTVVMGLSHGLRRLGSLNVGVMGGLGLSTDGESSIKEGGVFANLPLIPRRSSIDFEGGLSHYQPRHEGDDDLGPFAGATFRFAPRREERLFLLGGARYSHEDVALRFGLSLGRD